MTPDDFDAPEPDPSLDAQLVAELGKLRAEVRAVEVAVASAANVEELYAVKRAQQARTRFGAIALLLTLVLSVASVVLITQIQDARRQRARVVCVLFNRANQQARDAIRDVVTIWHPEPTDAVVLDERLAQRLPYRECTTEAIAERLKNPPPDPATTQETPR